MNAVLGTVSTPEAGSRIFIVEDEALISMELQDRLATLGYAIAGTASRGEDALQAIPANQSHLVLMDVRLAGALSGIETAARLHEYADVPVIFLSAYSDAELLRQAGAAQPFGYLVKPFEERELHATIQMALYRHRMERALRESYGQLEIRVKDRTAELARSRADLEVLLDSIGDGVLATDAQGRITRMNPVSEQLTGWTEAAAVGRPVSEVFRIVHEVTRNPALLPVDQVLATGERQSLANHTALIRRDGTEVSIADSAAPIRDANGAVIGVVLVFRDETEARERRRLVARQARMLSALRVLQQEFIYSPDANPHFDKILAVLLQTTDSASGFVAEVQWRSAGLSQLDLRAAKGHGWTELLQVANSAVVPASDTAGRLVGLLRDAVQNGIAVIDAAAGLASGESAGIGPFLAAPIIVAGTVVGIVGVANRADSYDEGVLTEIQPLLATCGSLIQGRRGAAQRRAAEDSLRELNVNLEAEVERRTAERRTIEEALRVISTELVALGGEDFHRMLAQRLTSLLEADVAIVARFKSEKPGFLDTLAIFKDGRFVDNFCFRKEDAGWTNFASQQGILTTRGAAHHCVGRMAGVVAGMESIAAVPLVDPVGSAIGILVVMSRRPLTRLAREQAILPVFAISASAEIERQRSARRFHDLFEFSPDAIVMTDRLGSITLINRQAEAMFGWGRGDITGQSIAVLMPEHTAVWQELPRERAGAGALILPPSLALPNQQAKRRDGSSFPVEISLGSIDTGDGIMIAAAIRDITDRLNAQRQANRAQRLESIGTLAGGIAHDLNNTLTPILLGLDVLKSEYAGDAEILETIEHSAHHAAEMVRQLLAYAKGTEGRRTSLQPLQLLEDMQKIIKSTFPKSISIRMQASRDLPTVLGDATQLHQVLLNLCVNARDAMPKGGLLTLEAEAVPGDSASLDAPPQADGVRPSYYVVLRVSDTGIGMAAEVVERIFDPFFTTKGPDIGTGMGLFTVAGIVKGHNGFIRVQSELTIGSTFTVYLPAEVFPAGMVTPNSPSSTYSGDGETILYVDDESSVREIARTVLTKLNFRPLIAADGMSGLAQAMENRAVLRAVITDLHMPHVDGLAFVRALRLTLPDLAVIVASGRLEAYPEQEFRKLGVQVMLQKPFTQDMLGAALQSVLTRAR